MPAVRKSKAQLEQERQAKVNARLEKERRKKAEAARKAEEAKHKAWLRAQRAIPSAYQGETMYVHKRVYDGLMKRKDVSITSMKPKVVGGKHSLVIEYTTRTGRGTMELNDLGPMP